MRWRATQEQCRRNYSRDDYEVVLSVPNVRDLRTYLQDVGRAGMDIVLRDKTHEIIQSLGTFKQLADEIDQSMEPNKLDFASVWGSIAFLVQFS